MRHWNSSDWVLSAGECLSVTQTGLLLRSTNRLLTGMSSSSSFASTVHGNELSEEEQWAKIQLCNEIVAEVWGKQ